MNTRKLKTLVLVNTLNAVSSFIYSNHIAFWCWNKVHLPDMEFEFFTPPRMSIDMARNMAAKIALEKECDYLLFIDDDVLIPAYTLPVLISANADITAALVIIRGYPFHVMAFKHEDKELPFFDELPTVIINDREVLKDPVTQEDGLAAVGFSCCLIRTALLRKMRTPYFITGPRNTEDVYFCLRARDTINTLRLNDDSIPPLSINLVTSIQCGHFLHPEPIEYRTIDIFKQLYEELDPNLKANSERPQDQRDIDYIKRNLGTI